MHEYEDSSAKRYTSGEPSDAESSAARSHEDVALRSQPSGEETGAEPRPHPPGLIMLQELHLQECKLGPVGFVNFCRSLRRGALHALLKLGIEGNHIEDAAVEPLTVALANNGAMPKLKFVLGLPARGGITAVETLFKVMGHRRGSWEMMNELKAEIKRPVEW